MSMIEPHVPYLANDLIGELFGDRGYISKKLTELLATQDVELITTLKKNMKPRFLVDVKSWTAVFLKEFRVVPYILSGL